VGKGISVTGKTLPHAKVVVTLPNGSKRTGTADAKGIFRIPVGLVNAADNLEIFVTGQNTKSKSYTKSKTGNVPRVGLTREEKEDSFVREAQSLSPKELIDSLPEGWVAKKVLGSSDGKPRVIIEDSKGIVRIRIDAPDKIKSKHSTDNYHMHKYDKTGKNHLDSNDNVVGRKDPAGHIPYDWEKDLIKLIIPKGRRF